MTSSNPFPVVERSSSVAKPERWLSVDVLRGLTIGFMILVNNNGDEQHAYWALKHASWNGFTPTDLVFPTFLFLVGISTVFSTAARLAKGATKQSILWHTLRRAVVLFLLGLLVNSFPLFHLHTLRVYGVLQRIAICYFNHRGALSDQLLVEEQGGHRNRCTFGLLGDHAFRSGSGLRHADARCTSVGS